MEEGEKIIAILNQNEKKNNNEDEILTQEKLKESYGQLLRLGAIGDENICVNIARRKKI